MGAVAFRVDRQYNTTGAQDCPGTNECQDLKKTAEEQQEKLRREGQFGCHKCPRGPAAAPEVDREMEAEFCDRVERLILERRCGFPSDPKDVLSEERELILAWEKREQEHRHALAVHMAETGAMMKAFIEGWTKKA